jgi:hypothetical protein
MAKKAFVLIFCPELDLEQEEEKAKTRLKEGKSSTSIQ